MILDSALRLAEKGLRIFPLAPNTKVPPKGFLNFQDKATTNQEQIRLWWDENPEYNIGISTKYLVAVDVDCGPGKVGAESQLNLELSGKIFPDTFIQKTPSGGSHYVYRVNNPIKQGTSILGKHIDIRAFGGYIVGSGSLIDGTPYTDNDFEVDVCPAWIVDTCGLHEDKPKQKVSEDAAAIRARIILNSLPVSEMGDRNHDAFKAACLLKDAGVSKTLCKYLMIEHFKSEPPLENSELTQVVSSAYRYGKDALGIHAPENAFTPVSTSEDAPLSPIQQLNKEFALVLTGGGSHILWETRDAEERPIVDHLSVVAFHQLKAASTMTIGNKTLPVTKIWMNHPDRRTYDGVCFIPGKKVSPKFYNFWKGFAVEPSDKVSAKAKQSLNMFLEHAKENVCGGEEFLFNWLIGYFAHLVQFPGEKPLTAIVFKGSKGVGKNALVERVGYLLGPHFKVANDRRYLLGNFNSHLEKSLLFVLDEAFWSGDKQAEGMLKGLITGQTHIIEHKGKEPYEVKNCTRVVIIGNEEWLVPASNDERRFAVFNVGEKRKQDQNFFKNMREGMEDGGYKILLKYLLDYDISGINVNEAPKTKGLLEQKLESLPPFAAFWFNCLREEKISFLGDDWPSAVDKNSFRQAFKNYVQERNLRHWIPADNTLGKLFKQYVPAVTDSKIMTNEQRKWAYRLPTIDECRTSWEKFIGQSISW